MFLFSSNYPYSTNLVQSAWNQWMIYRWLEWMIENPGTFPPNWDAERMKSEHESKPQNPLLANALYKRKVLESWGRGIGLMMSECRKAGLPEPEYRIWSDSVTLIFKCEVTNRPSADQAPTKCRPGTDQVFALVKILNKRELSVREIMEAFTSVS